MPRTDFKFSFKLRVRWSECDAQGIVFNAEYLNYIEVAQVEYYRNLGVLLYDENARKYFDVATVKVTLEYKASAKVDDIIEVCLRVERIGNSSITMMGEIYRAGTEDLLTRAEIVYVDYDSNSETSRPVPDDIRELIEHYERTGAVLPRKSVQ